MVLAVTLLPGKDSPKVPFPVPNTSSFVFESPMTSVLLQKFVLIVLNVMEKCSSTGSVISGIPCLNQACGDLDMTYAEFDDGVSSRFCASQSCRGSNVIFLLPPSKEKILVKRKFIFCNIYTNE